MIPKWSELQTMSDEDLIDRYNRAAENTSVGTRFYLEELNRRAATRQTDEIVKLTRWITWLTVAVVILTVVVLAVSATAG
jgi:hypothetical protein